MSLTKAQMVSLIEDDIIHRSDKTTLVGYAINWGLEYIDKSGHFDDLEKEEITLTTISCTFETTDVDASTDIITTSIDIPTGTKIVFTSDDTVPAGLTASTTYWCVRQSSTTIKVATSHKNAWAGTTVDITDTGTGTHTVTAYRERLAKPDSCKFIQSIRLIDGGMSRKLEAMTYRQADTFVPFEANNGTGKPSQYVEYKDWVQLNCIPDDTYVIKIRYVKWQDEFDEDSDTAEVAHTDDLIVKAACIHIWEMLGEPEQSALMEKAVNIGLAKHKRFVSNMKPDLVLKPHGGTVRSSASDMQDDPFRKA